MGTTEKNRNLTRDGLDIKIDSYYYRQNGEIVYIDGIIESKQKVVCHSYIEGTAMDCKLYPSGHAEIEIDYEHESEEFTLGFNQLYSEVPLFVLEPSFKRKQEELDELTKKIGVAKVELKLMKEEIEDKKIRYKYELDDLNNQISEAYAKIENLVKNLTK